MTQVNRDVKTVFLVLAFIAACQPDPDRAGTRDTAPAYEGDTISATVPARHGLTPREMFDQVVAPLLRQRGLGSVVPSLTVPPRGYIYQQRVDGVPVEQAVIVATPGSVQGKVFSRYRIANRVALSVSAATPRDRTAARADVVLYPVGSATDGPIVLRYVYRMLLADRADPSRTWMAWIDAESGHTVMLAPQFTEE